MPVIVVEIFSKISIFVSIFGNYLDFSKKKKKKNFDAGQIF